ncbi:MAG: sulfurtransferase [Leptolyngbya sp. SIOISBB]|nr:sulfurtransferase [Leptolyngbya sp. SIOISBB]
MTDYSRPDSLVETQWLATHLNDPSVRIIEVGMSPEDCENAHIPGAVFWSIPSDLMTSDRSMNLDVEALSALLSKSGTSPETTVVTYGSNPATGANIFWLLKRFGHDKVYVLNGGHQKWMAEGRPMTSTLSRFEPVPYAAPNVAPARDRDYRILTAEVQDLLNRSDTVILDVRTSAEYRGEIFMGKPPEGNERSGHIPSAVHLEHTLALNEDGTFKSAAALHSLYAQQGITKDKRVIPYCAVGARSGFTWYVLKYLLGYPNVQNYDGSWNEWSRLPHAPIA